MRVLYTLQTATAKQQKKQCRGRANNFYDMSFKYFLLNASFDARSSKCSRHLFRSMLSMLFDGGGEDHISFCFWSAQFSPNNLLTSQWVIFLLHFQKIFS